MNNRGAIEGVRKTLGGVITNTTCRVTGSKGLARGPGFEYRMIASLGMAWLGTHDPEV